jgi:hypothetical protein
MGLLDQLSSMLGGQHEVERLANGRGNFADPNSPDHDRFGRMLGHANPEDLQASVRQAADNIDAQDYSDHITPGVNGTNPLGMVGQGGLSTIASAIMGHLTGQSGQGGGAGGILGGLLGGGGGGGSFGSLLNRIPGLRTTDPNQMDASQVAVLADYARRNNPDAFSRAASQIGQQNPSLLQHLLGNKFLQMAAAGLAAKFISDRFKH